MNSSNSTSRDHSLDPSQGDGIRPVRRGVDSGLPDSPQTGPNGDTGPNEVVPGARHRGVDQSAPQERAASAPSPADRAPRLTRASAAWAAIIAALLLSVVLIVFVLQNPTMVVIRFLGWSGSLAVGMAMLIAAVTGGLLVATIGVARLTQLRVRAHHTRSVPQ
jgi:uncharacterized integral membrane protein